MPLLQHALDMSHFFLLKFKGLRFVVEQHFNVAVIILVAVTARHSISLELSYMHSFFQARTIVFYEHLLCKEQFFKVPK
jgi:hypothetical protein